MKNMRSQWFNYVKQTRAKESRKRKREKGKESAPCSHREAMRIASETWGKEKTKLIKRQKRLQKVSVPVEKVEESLAEN